VACGQEGTIEDIGFRASKLRTPAGHLVTIPNSNIVNGPIENVSRRPAVRRVVNLIVAVNTPYEKLCAVIAALEGIFDEEGIRGPVRPTIGAAERLPQVRVDDIQKGGIKLAVTYWYAPSTDPNHAAHTDRVNLRIIEKLQQAGVELV
jgi:MscS family membrane protein